MIRRLQLIKGEGFSLIEVVLALGIISFALVGIMGLFPIALKSSQESQRETRATIIAQQIVNDLRSLPGPNTIIVTNTNVSGASAAQPVNLGVNNNISLSFDANGEVLGGGGIANAAFAVNVQTTPNLPLAGISRVQTTVTSQGSSYQFITFLDQ